MTATIALPESTRVDTTRRIIVHRWDRPEVEVADAMRAVEVTVTHDKDRKQYVASIHLIDVHEGYVTAHISPYHGMRLHREPAGRYSAKGLQDVNAFMMGVLPTLVATDERVARLFSGQPLPGAR